MTNITIEVKPFSWNDNFSEIALEDFDSIRSSLGYCAAQSIGTALAKLQLMEKEGLYPNVIEKIMKRLEERSFGAYSDVKLLWLSEATAIIKEEVRHD